MALTKQKKEKILSELKGQIKDSSLIVFVNFHGLNTILNRELRSLIKKTRARYFVAKKTLIKRALDEFNFFGEMPELEGEVALVFAGDAGDDIVQPVKALADFRKKNPQINFLGGVVEKVFVDRKTIAGLAKLPTRDVLIAQFINVIGAPQRGLVGVMSAVPRSFVIALNEIKNSRS